MNKQQQPNASEGIDGTSALTAGLATGPSEFDREGNRAWLERHGGPILPPGLWEDGMEMQIIRSEIQKASVNAAYVRVLKPPPQLLR